MCSYKMLFAPFLLFLKRKWSNLILRWWWQKHLLRTKIFSNDCAHLDLKRVQIINSSIISILLDSFYTNQTIHFLLTFPLPFQRLVHHRPGGSNPVWSPPFRIRHWWGTKQNLKIIDSSLKSTRKEPATSKWKTFITLFSFCL